MSAQPLFVSLNALYLALMALVSLVGTAALLKLIAVLVTPEQQHPFIQTLESEDA